MKKILYKKILYGFLAFVFGIFFGGLVSFCSADGIYHNPDLGLISIVYNDSSNVLTFSDKNIGATCTDISSSCSFGSYFQWGNNFQFSGTSFSCNTTQNFTIPSDYGPGNYYYNYTFYYSYNNGGNYDLWGAVTGTPESMQGPCPDGFHIIDNWENVQDIFVNYFSVSSNSSYGFLNYLKMPLAGFIERGGSFSCGTYGGLYTAANYWASSSYSTINANRVAFNSSTSNLSNELFSYGSSVRCVKNISVSPDYTRTKLYGDTIYQPVEISVFYNNDNDFVKIQCDGDNSIHINGLSTVSNSVFTPYFNIDYVDEDNQILTESYSKDILYLSGSRFKKTFTGDNEWILTTQGNENSVFTGYTPVFDVTGSTDVLNTGNIFNNFSDNSLKVLLSNIPSYIQYVTIFAILMFLFGFIRRFKRKR